jgi:hypothetical protein
MYRNKKLGFWSWQYVPFKFDPRFVIFRVILVSVCYRIALIVIVFSDLKLNLFNDMFIFLIMKGHTFPYLDMNSFVLKT